MHSHDANTGSRAGGKRTVALLGNPNVGKSVIFGLLTGKYVMVSNYPGTTVEVTRGKASFDGGKTLVIDTPGTNSLIPTSEDEQVTRDMILKEDVCTVVQVADAKNLRRALFLALQLAEARVPFVLALNMLDEAASRGIVIDRKQLSLNLGVDVVPMVATRRQGIRRLIKRVKDGRVSPLAVDYDGTIEQAIESMTPMLPETTLSKRSLSLMLLAGDETLESYLAGQMGEEDVCTIRDIRESLCAQYGMPISHVINQSRLEKADEILVSVMSAEEAKPRQFSAVVGNLCVHPVFGIPILLAVLYLTYWIVGVFAAGTCVDFLESTVFGEYINPTVTKIVEFLIPVKIVQEALVGEYGAITMATTYALAIVLPIVGFFFVVFGLLEDSGYLPRLALLVNRIFRLIGLNGKAVLPMILGLGCATMATITARILPSKKDRIIVTLLLALAVPCSAQLGVIFGETTAISPKVTMLWASIVLGIMLLVGYFSSKILPGTSSDFILEIPPMRIPKLINILTKTLARIEWYAKEAVPLFILGTFVLFLLEKMGLLALIENACAPIVVNLLGLPKETAGAFVMGFLRRDYAAVLIVKSTNLEPLQVLVAFVTITLFVPCIANLFVMVKERGLKTATFITCFIFVFAFLVGGMVNFTFRFLGITL